MENLNTEPPKKKKESPSVRQILMALTGKEKVSIKFWLDILLDIAIIIGLVVIIRTFFISPFQVYGPSMCDTLNNFDGTCHHEYGEYIIVDKLSYQNFFGLLKVGEPKRGDIVIFRPPKSSSEFFIKRVIGLPGETVKLQNGYVYIYNDANKNGYKLQEDYLNAKNSGNTHPDKDYLTEFTVPAGYYFVMGDNRTESSDSRACFRETAYDNDCGKDKLAAFVPFKNIEGKAWLILWPLQKIGLAPTTQY